jgi:hypothetical protein|uniref:Uncharacterized protein n=2 Tax=Picea TaxID=3328 RepID=A0A117NHQ4_PICGL|nr:hypothetical protein ABT39_MTgene4680 [Picea glauca]QHR89781.1 hypothetical protein Q903MT_gene3803 [Picea sitchensis]
MLGLMLDTLEEMLGKVLVVINYSCNCSCLLCYWCWIDCKVKIIRIYYCLYCCCCFLCFWNSNSISNITYIT